MAETERQRASGGGPAAGSRTKLLLTLFGTEIAPRFDLTTEVLIAALGPGGEVESRRTVVLPHASAEDLCHLIVSDGVNAVVCCGIEEEYHQYLTWKRVTVLDSVMGPCDRVLEEFRRGSLAPGANLYGCPAGVRPDA